MCSKKKKHGPLRKTCMVGWESATLPVNPSHSVRQIGLSPLHDLGGLHRPCCMHSLAEAEAPADLPTRAVGAQKDASRIILAGESIGGVVVLHKIHVLALKMEHSVLGLLHEKLLPFTSCARKSEKHRLSMISGGAEYTEPKARSHIHPIAWQQGGAWGPHSGYGQGTDKVPGQTDQAPWECTYLHEQW